MYNPLNTGSCPCKSHNRPAQSSIGLVDVNSNRLQSYYFRGKKLLLSSWRCPLVSLSTLDQVLEQAFFFFNSIIDYSRITFAEKCIDTSIPAFNSRGKGVSPCSDQWLMPVEKFQSYCQSAQSSWKMIGSICDL